MSESESEPDLVDLTADIPVPVPTDNLLTRLMSDDKTDDYVGYQHN